MICDNCQNKVLERGALIPGSLNGWLSWKITFFETDNAPTFRKELKSSRLNGNNATRLSPDLSPDDNDYDDDDRLVDSYCRDSSFN